MLGHAKVQDLHLPGIGEHDIFRLDVAMNDAVLMRSRQRLRTLCRDSEKLLERHRPPQTLPQGLAFHVFQDQEYLALLFQNIEHRGYVRIAEAGCVLGFFEETAPVGGIGAQMGGKTLEGNPTFEFGVLGAIHLAHAPFSQPVTDAETSHDTSGKDIRRLRRTRQRGLELRHRGS